jgi:hypothetical protein
MPNVKPIQTNELVLKVELLIQRVDTFIDETKKDRESQSIRLRDVENANADIKIELTKIKERQTVLALIQTALTVLAGVAVYLLK